MRLIKRDSNGGLSLHEFQDQNLPAYAILSHTWIRDHEITFDEFNTVASRDKAGYAKIQFCGARAAQDGLEYFWVDTCCIDKRNNTELSTAINSMFNVEAPAPDKSTNNEYSQRTWQAFRDSRWFTRGWTLQELLAPSIVEFFSKEGTRLGSKESLERIIHDITHIPLSALRESDPRRFSIDERMSWIRTRNTTVKEDKAYCLLGIFGVFLPLLYGEGEAHAFERLREAAEGQGRRSQSTNTSGIRSMNRDHMACLRSLAFSTLDVRREDIAFAHPDTCDWLLKTAEFCKWRDGTDFHDYNGVLWLKGKPGVGKSTLMKHALSHCKERFSDHMIAAFFFNARGERLEQTALGMLRSTVYQLAECDRGILDRFTTRFHSKQMTQESGLEWRSSELRDFIISEMARQQRKPILLFVDALDECSESDVREVVKLLEGLSITAVSAGNCLRICLSSRHYPNIDMKKKLEVVVESNKDHKKGIARYIADELDTEDEEIRYEVQKKADGVFLWVILVVAMLNESYRAGRIEEMQSRLHDLPSDLEEVFETMLAKGNTHLAETVLMLQWVLFSPEPLSPKELFFAVMIKVAPEVIGLGNIAKITDTIIRNRITGSSVGLIEVRPGRNSTVQFIHTSVNDFLLRNKRLQKLDPTLGHEALRTSHKELWSCCWKYIQLADLAQTNVEYLDEVNSVHPFMRYAIGSVLYFANLALADDKSYQVCSSPIAPPCSSEDPGCHFAQETCEISQWILDSERSWFQFWVLFLDRFDEYDVEYDLAAGLLYASCLNGYQRIIKILLSGNTVDVDAQGGRFGNALQAASYGGSQEVVELLLAVGANANAQGGEYGNALQAASYRGQQKVVQLLLNAGANVNTQGGEYGNALQAASFRGQQEVVQLLLNAGANVNTQGGEYGNALQAASSRGRQKVVQLLLNAGAEVNAQGGLYGNALQAASSGGWQKVVQLLLNAGAEVNAQGGPYDNALQAASVNGYQEVIKMLLDGGARYLQLGDNRAASPGL